MQDGEAHGCCFEAAVPSPETHNRSVQGSITRWHPSKLGQATAGWTPLQKYFLSKVALVCARLRSGRAFQAIPRSSKNVSSPPLSTLGLFTICFLCVLTWVTPLSLSISLSAGSEWISALSTCGHRGMTVGG